MKNDIECFNCNNFNKKNKAIVIAHGLFMQKEVMVFLEKKLKNKGYTVYNFNYNSRQFNNKTIEDFKVFVEKIPEKNLYFVGHSLGGLLIRHYFEKYKPVFNDTCIVTLATPHNGSSFGSRVSNSFLSKIMGTSHNAGLLTGLKPWNPKLADLGCVIGTLNIGFNTVFNPRSGISDGTVLTTEALADNSKDFIFVRQNHTFIIYSNNTANLIDLFIETRKFK